MPYHLPEWIWYVAQLVIETHIEGQTEPIYLIESVLFRADSPSHAYEKAMARCDSAEHVYRNKVGGVVRQRYLGIHDLDDLQAQEMEDEQVLHMQVVSRSNQHGSQHLVRSKSELTLFFGGESPEFRHLDQ